MATSTKSPRPLQPATGSFRWISDPASLALRFRCGASAALAIGPDGGEEVGYVLTPHLSESGELLGWRLERADNGKCYDLPADLSACDCKDSLYRDRPGGCKHRKALRAALASVGK
jgi:hypothetical protein